MDEKEGGIGGQWEDDSSGWITGDYGKEAIVEGPNVQAGTRGCLITRRGAKGPAREGRNRGTVDLRDRKSVV